jgi:hypothetical protein
LLALEENLMRDRPTGAELTILVQCIEEGDPDVEVPPDARYRKLMLASAEAISGRQLENGAVSERQERNRLNLILNKEGNLMSLNRELVEAIREGRFDTGTNAWDQVRDHLWLTAIDRVSESNPKALIDLS